MKQYRIVVKGDRNSAKYFAQRRFLLIFWIPIPFHSVLYGGENFYDDAVDVIKNYKSRYKKKYYLEDWIMKVWIARDESGAIFIHRHKPEKRRYGNAGVVWESTDYWQLYHRDYPGVTFENSPMEVELVLKK